MRPATLALLVVTAIWGSTFFLIKDVVTRIEVADLLAVRFALASLGLAVLLRFRLRLSRPLLMQGAGLGLLYGGAQILQTLGLAHTSASVSGFLTGLYVVATPLLGAAILRQRIRGTTWAAVVLATVGLGVLSLTGVSTGYGELLTVASAVVYAGHILALGRISMPGTALSLSLVQLVVITLVCAVLAVLPVSGAGLQLPVTGRDWIAVAYLGLVAGAVTMVAQTWAQARIDPTRAAVIMGWSRSGRPGSPWPSVARWSPSGWSSAAWPSWPPSTWRNSGLVRHRARRPPPRPGPDPQFPTYTGESVTEPAKLDG
jgi:drug/metabolite transporter (DMT)-like permease